MNLFIDIETIPGQTPYIREDIAVNITAPGQYKKQESIEKWLADNRSTATDDQWRKTSFSGTLGEVICIGYALDDNDPVSVQRELGGSEADMIDAFFTNVKDQLGERTDGLLNKPDMWIGHNITGFDLRFLWQRCVLTGAKPLFGIPIKAKPWDDVIFDTMTEWRGIGAKAGGSLQQICKAMSIETKDDLDGSKVWDYVKDGRIDEVAEYCRKDVMRTREIYKRISSCQ